MQYSIKSVPSDNTKALEDLLNEMSQDGWDLYSIQEVELDDEFQFNCIFAKTGKSLKEEEEEDVVNISTFKSQMEKMLSSTLSPYESCKELQEKIKEQRKKITKIKSQLEAQSETPISKNRQKLNDDMSQGLKDLEDLRQKLIKTISPDLMYSKIRQEKLSIQLSEEALDLVNPDLGAVLIAETVKLREKIVDELGYVIPKIVFEGDEKLNAYEFSIKIRGIEVINSFVYPDYLMFFEDDLKLDKKLKDAIYAVDGITDQDKKIAATVIESGKGLVVAINKWDLIEDKQTNTMRDFEKKIAKDVPFLDFAPKIYISAVTKQRLNRIFEKAAEVYEQCTKRVSTGVLNKIISEAYAMNPPSTVKNKRLKILYSTQINTQPPTFVLFTNNGDLMKDHYKRYLEKKIRESFGFFGTPIRIALRERSDKKNK